MIGQQGLEVRELSYQYPDGPRIFSEWTAAFAAGGITAVTGPSGRGKSTALYLLGLMVRPSSGKVYVDGVETSGLSDRQRAWLRACHFGFVFQDAALDLTRTVLDNVLESALYRGQDRTLATSRAVDLLDRFDVAVPAHRRPGQVSGGQAQRIALCRALLHTPKVVLADEPTGNLDRESAETVFSALREHAHAGNTVVIVTHSERLAMSCDARLVLE